MYWRPFILILFIALLSACAPKGPVKFYEGATKPPSEIARVKVPGPITTLEIDGREINSPSQQKGFYELHLMPGYHRITFKYELYWEFETVDGGALYKSAPRELAYNFAAGKVYELVFKNPTSEYEALTMVGDFQATLADADGTKLVVSYDPDKPPVETAATRELAANQTPVVANPMPSAEQASHEDAVKRLKFWWLMASEKEREEFRQWMQTDMPNFQQQ